MSTLDAFRSLVIVNPSSGAGAAGRRWNRIANLLRRSLGEFNHVMTSAPNEATAIARHALREGYEMIVAVGGDGTLNEVAAGFFEGTAPIAPNAVLGVIAVGTGSDFGRTLGQTDLASACMRLEGRHTRNIDVGFAQFANHDGTTATRIFMNVASFGVGGLVTRLVSPRLKSLSGRVAFTLATLRALALYKDQTVTLQFDDAPSQSIAITNCAFGNGRFFGAGMQVAPGAELDDGLLEATIWSGFRLVDFIRKRRTLYDGTHLREPGARTLQVRHALATSVSTVLLEIDGESAGRLPLRVKVLPRAIRLKV